MARIYDGDMVEAMRSVTVHVRLVRVTEYRFRVWLGMRLFALAAWVMNCNIAVDDMGADGDEA